MRLIPVERILQTGSPIESRLQRQLAKAFADYGRDASKLAYLMTGDREIAEDLTQEAFVRLLGRFGTLRNPTAVHSYLRRTIVNLARSYFRRRSTERAYVSKERSRPFVGVESTDLEERRDMFDLLQLIPHRQRAALVLRFYLDLSESQTAEVLHTSPKAVNGLVARGLKSLRQEYEGAHEQN